MFFCPDAGGSHPSASLGLPLSEEKGPERLEVGPKTPRIRPVWAAGIGVFQKTPRARAELSLVEHAPMRRGLRQVVGVQAPGEGLVKGTVAPRQISSSASFTSASATKF